MESSLKPISTLKIGITSVTVTERTANSVTLSWVQIPGALRYNIYRGLGTGPASLVGTVNATSGATCVWTDDRGLSASTNYRYRVSGVLETGEAGFLDWVSATTLFAGTPTGVTATANSSTNITMSWTAVSGATRYHIERSTSAGGTYTEVTSPTSGTTGTSYTNTGLSPGTTYYYKVRAYSSSSSSYGDYSTPVSATTPIQTYYSVATTAEMNAAIQSVNTESDSTFTIALTGSFSLGTVSLSRSNNAVLTITSEGAGEKTLNLSSLSIGSEAMISGNLIVHGGTCPPSAIDGITGKCQYFSRLM